MSSTMTYPNVFSCKQAPIDVISETSQTQNKNAEGFHRCEVPGVKLTEAEGDGWGGVGWRRADGDRVWAPAMLVLMVVERRECT